MSTTSLTNVLADDGSRKLLMELSKKYAELSIEIEYLTEQFANDVKPYKDKVDEITKRVKILGLKPTEFTRISKLLSQSELLYNEAAFLDQLIGLLDE